MSGDHNMHCSANQPDALRLAELCEGSANAGSTEPWTRRQAAAELRRLQSVEIESKERILRLEGALVKEVAINAQLLEALQRLRKMCTPELSHQEALMCRVIDAAIAAAKEQA